MSALDQAFIKAYAKDQPADRAAAVASRGAPPRAVAGARVAAGAIEQVYRDGSLYRVDLPARISPSAAAIPQPHVKLLPPTSPRRSVQRSLLRLLANQPVPPPADAELPPKVARKVIIRHIAHSIAPAPLGLLRPEVGEPLTLAEVDELPPETIIEWPPAPAVAPPPAPIAAPQTAPLNEAHAIPQLVEERPIAVHGQWALAESAAGLVVVAEPAEFDEAGSDGLVAVRLESLTLPEPPAAEPFAEESLVEAADFELHEAERTRFAGKSLDDADNGEPAFRVDPPHAASIHRPHARFTAEPQPVDELTLAETPPEPQTQAEAAAPVESPAAEPASATSVAPLWEVDRFHWPKTCEKLLSAEGSYFVHAGAKLVAAVKDGLRVLAITGTRRGEGRTTLALCLARVAAQAGVQAAIMDADFARPQLASKIGLAIAHGWQDAALGKIPLSEAAVKSLADQVTALPLEAAGAASRLSLADPRVTATIRAAAATFELLILDLGPVGPGEEVAFPPGEKCPLDAAIVVRDMRFATLAESEAIGHGLSDAGVEAVGIAENFVVEEEPQYSS
ncbi:MAG TPA: hypothetical protein VFB80_00700 [Pirellulaceae bacterium]|nr:hypothetical protein [Pirellulaceae bacterium]